MRRLAELVALSAFAIAQPLLDAMGRSPEFFLYRRGTRPEIIGLIVILVLAPPLALWIVEAAVAPVSARAADLVHGGFVAALFAAIVVHLGKHFDLLSGAPLAAVALAAGAVLAVLRTRSTALREILLVAAPAPLVFALAFVLTTPAGALVRGGHEAHVQRAKIGHRPPVVFLFLDEFPLRALLDEHGRIEARLYPNFARLARETTWYPNATGVSGFTPFAAPAMLSGRFPARVLAPSYTEYPRTLYTLLGGTYRIRAFETITELCPRRLCRGVPAGRATGLGPMLSDTWSVGRRILSPYRSTADPTHEFVEDTVDAARHASNPAKSRTDVSFRIAETARNQPERFRAFMSGLGPSPTPTLHFLHILLPHGPWRYLPSGERYFDAPNSFVPPPPGHPATGTLSDDPLLAVVGRQRLLLQLAYTDRLLGRFLDRMHSTGLWDRSLVILTADHGSGLAPGTRSRRLDARNPLDLAWVPLFVKTPGQRRGRVDRRNEMHVDLLPTIADVLDVRVPWHMEGISMLGPPRRTGAKTWVNDPGHRIHYRQRDWLARVRRGFGPDTIRPDRGRAGQFMVGTLARLVGRRVAQLRVGPRLPIDADLVPANAVAHADRASGQVPAMLWGTLSAPVARRSTWLAVAVNGTIAGSAVALPGGDGRWRYLGMVDDAYLRQGRNRVALYAVRGGVLRPLRLDSTP